MKDLFFKGRDVKVIKNENLTPEFKELLFWKKEFKKVIKAMEDADSQQKIDLFQRKQQIEKKLDAAERNMFDVANGLYFGVGYLMNDDPFPKPMPIIGKWGNLNNHVGFKGTTRVGKSVNMYGHIEQCIAAGYDCIIIDPKGGVKQEVLSSTVESCFRYKRAEDLTYYSPAFPSISQKINVCYGLSNIELTGTIIESIRTKEMDSFYLETAEEILMSILTSFEYLQEVSDPTGEITKLLERQEVIKYHKYLNNKNHDEYDFLHVDAIEDVDLIEEYEGNVLSEQEILEFKENGFNRSLITFKELEYYCHYRELKSLRTLVKSVEIDTTVRYRKNVKILRNDALRLLNSALATEENHFSKVSKTLSNRLTALSVGPIGDLLCSIRINPLMNRLLRRDRGVVSVIQPFPMKFKGASKVFNKMLLGMLNGMMGTVGAEGRALPRRVAIFIDEAGAIAFPGIEDFFNKAGGLGATVFVYTQTDEDYKEAVGETLADIIIDSVNTKGIMRQNAPKSKRNVAEEIGTYTDLKTLAMVSSGGDGKYTTDTVEKYLCDMQDVMALPVGEGIFMHNGKTYYMEFPYRRPPLASVKMPELDNEVEKRVLAAFEQKLEEQMKEERLSA